MRGKYDWRMADKALSIAVAELYGARRHFNHRKRVNVLNDLCAVEAQIQKVRKALEPALSVDAVDPVGEKVASGPRA